MIIASKHFPRIITGAVLVSVLGTALYLSGPYLFGLLLLFTLVGLWEFYAMFWPFKANIGGRILGRSAACSSPPHGCAPKWSS